MQHLDHLISAMHYPHWMMIGGGVLVTVGFLGFALQKNADTERPQSPFAEQLTPPRPSKTDS